MSRPAPIIDRIRAAFKDGERKLTYHAVARRVFPEEQFPRAWRYSSNGGPPGCFMALSAALRRHKIEWWYDRGSNTRWIGRPKP